MVGWRGLVGVVVVAALAGRSSAQPCLDSQQCTGTNYLCDLSSSTCVPGVALCTGDDIGDQAGGDDWKTAARPIAIGQRISAAICGGGWGAGSVPPLSDEADWYAVDLAADQKVAIEISSSGLSVNTVTAEPFNETASYYVYPADLRAGRNYVWIKPYGGAFTTAIPYDIYVHAVECTSDSECTSPATPSCGNGSYRCVPGGVCAGDDVRDGGSGDDTPLGATVVALVPDAPLTLDGALCAVPWTADGGREADWMMIHAAQGQGLEISVAGSPTTLPYVEVFGPGGDLYGASDGASPLRLTYLPEADYFVRFKSVAPEPFVGVPQSPTESYQATFLLTEAQSCVSRADCAAEYATQLFRGDCQSGACTFITSASAVGDACDAHAPAACECTYKPYYPGADQAYCAQYGGICFANGRCIGATGICRGALPCGDHHCMCGFCGGPGRCGPCQSDVECGYDSTCNDRGQCEDGPGASGLPPFGNDGVQPTEGGGNRGGGCSAGDAAGLPGLASLLLLLGGRQRRKRPSTRAGATDASQPGTRE